MDAPRERQLHVFVVLLGLATLAHEVYWLYLLGRLDHGPLFGYLDGYRLLLPGLPIPGGVAGLLHVALWGQIGLMVFHPRRIAVARLGLPLVAAQFFVQGMKPSNHLIVLTAAYAIFAVHGLCEWLRVRVLGDRAGRFAGQNLGFLREAVLFLTVTTYLFAGLAKLNTGFLDPQTTTARTFVGAGLVPVFAAVGAAAGNGTRAAVERATDTPLAVVGIASTYLLEFGLPLALTVPAWRRWGLAVGLLFHLSILYFSAIDFSMTMIALYALLPGAEDLDAFLRQYVFRLDRAAALPASVLTCYLSLCAFHEPWREHLPTAFELYRLAHIVAVSYLGCAAVRFAWGRTPSADGREVAAPAGARVRLSSPAPSP